MIMSPCSCGSQKPLETCCLPVIEKDDADTAEQLMRSRYTAYCLGKFDYVLGTYASEPRNKLSIDALRQGAALTHWLALVVHNASESSVSFSAYYSEQGKLYCLSETSQFVRENTKWRYFSGIPEQTGPLNLSRNAECFCGSGKKFKRCCLSRIT